MGADVLGHAWQQARQAWPGIELEIEVFRAYAGARRTADGSLPAHLTDLYLACAVSRGDAAAVTVLDEQVLRGVEPAIRRIARLDPEADEVRQAVRVQLLVGDPGAPRILDYRGAGPLHSWVRVVGVRTALNLARRRRPTLAVDEVLAEVAAGEPDPEIRHLKGTYRAEYAAALQAAVTRLSDRQRALLRLHFLDGVPLARIGALYQVHESTASRWVRRTLDEVAGHARTQLIERLALTGSDVDSIARLVRSGLDLSIRALLADRT